MSISTDANANSFFTRAGVTESTVIETVLETAWSGSLDWARFIATTPDRGKHR
jgi:hypothetical protein